MNKNYEIFISHSSVDSNLAFSICNHLEQNGLSCWIAPRDVQGGMEYAEAIMSGIKSCKIMIVVFSENANKSLFVPNEIERAFNYKSTIIPFKVDNTIPSAKFELFLGAVHWLDATRGNTEQHFEMLFEHCSRSLGNQNVSKPVNQKESIEYITPPVQKRSESTDIVGYYELHDESEKLNEIEFNKEQVRIEFNENDSYTISFRMRFPYLVLDDFGCFSESFLIDEKGTYRIDDGHIIFSSKSYKYQPQARQEILWNCLNNFQNSILKKQRIEKIISLGTDKFETEILGKDKKIVEYSRLHTLNKNIDAQENAEWVQNEEEQSELAEAIFNANSAPLDLFEDGHIDDLDDFVDEVVESFDGDFDDVEFNGAIPCFKENDWDEFDDDVLSNYNLSEEFEENITLVCSYYKEEQGWFSSNWYQVFIGMHVDPIFDEVNANLIFIQNKSTIWFFSMSKWLDDFSDVLCISDIKIDGDKLYIDSYKHSEDDEDPVFHDEIVLNPKINDVILRLWNKIQTH
jgi:hypothetical protein